MKLAPAWIPTSVLETVEVVTARLEFYPDELRRIRALVEAAAHPEPHMRLAVDRSILRAIENVLGWRDKER